MDLPVSAPLPERVAEAIRTRIAHGQLRPGERITEAQVAGWLSVSNNPVREAFYLLEQEGLLVREPRHGTYVRALDSDHVRDLYAVREALEQICYRLLVEKDALQPSDYEQLNRCIEQETAASAAGEIAHAVDLDLQFHDLLYERTGSEVLINLWSAIRGQIRVLINWRNMYVADSGRRHAPPHLHHRILQYLREGNLERLVADNKQRHVDNSAEIMQVLASAGSVAPPKVQPGEPRALESARPGETRH